MPSRDHVHQLLLECVREYSEQSGRPLALADDTPLLGPGAVINSLGLVLLVTTFEARLNETFNTELVLASESAMSMHRSPFSSLAALTDYAHGLLTTPTTAV
jgi:hypothetical protein